jgi:hypothetical protein
VKVSSSSVAKISTTTTTSSSTTNEKIIPIATTSINTTNATNTTTDVDENLKVVNTAVNGTKNGTIESTTNNNTLHIDTKNSEKTDKKSIIVDIKSKVDSSKHELSHPSPTTTTSKYNWPTYTSAMYTLVTSDTSTYGVIAGPTTTYTVSTTDNHPYIVVTSSSSEYTYAVVSATAVPSNAPRFELSCNYPPDQVPDDSRQDVNLTGSNFAKMNGWNEVEFQTVILKVQEVHQYVKKQKSAGVAIPPVGYTEKGDAVKPDAQARLEAVKQKFYRDGCDKETKLVPDADSTNGYSAMADTHANGSPSGVYVQAYTLLVSLIITAFLA